MLVIDTSVAVKWVVPETGVGLEADTDIALGLLTSAIIAPDCIAAEFANALYKKVQRSEISQEQAIASNSILPDLVAMLPTPGLVQSAFQIALALPHQVHDCIFLALAIKQNARLITADKKFVRRCQTLSSEFPIYLLSEQRRS